MHLKVTCITQRGFNFLRFYECLYNQLIHSKLFIETSNGLEESKKRHLYEVVEGESPESTPSTSRANDKGLLKIFPKIFPRSKDIRKEEMDLGISKEESHENISGSTFDFKSNSDFHKVTLI